MTERQHDCERVRELIQRWIDGPIDARALAELDGHLEGCEPCRAYRDEILSVRAALRAAPQLELPEETLDKVWAQTVDAEGGARHRQSVWVRTGIAAASIAATLVTALLVGGYWEHQRELAQAERDLQYMLQITDSALRRGEKAILQDVMRKEVAPSVRRAPLLFQDSGDTVR